LDDKTYKAGTIQNRISSAKNRLILPDAYAADRGICQGDMEAKVPATHEIYRRYWDRCRQSNVMDFDDLLVYTYLLFDSYPEICEKYARQFKYVLVDEYQDTNYAQHSIVQQLTRIHQKVCVVGDDAQSIYSFRGANIDNILKFTQLYKGARLFKLEQNYRSTQTIVCAANSLIEKNREQIRKEVFSEKQQGEPVTVFNAYSDVEEGDIVVNQIWGLHRREGNGFNDFAILYRTNAQSRIFEEALRKRNIPYKIYGGLSFYQRKEIKDVISYFRMAVNPNDEEAFRRVLNYPARGIGDATLNKLSAAANEHQVSLWKVLGEPLTYGVNINKGTHTKLQAFHELIEDFRTEASEKNAYEVGSYIVRRSGIMNEIYQDRSPENLSRQENIEELVNGMHDFVATRQEEGNEHVALTDYLQEVSLLTDQDSDKEGDGEKITLMTIHSAKGLEFKNVFVVGLEENLFPSPMSSDSVRGLEEERRLFYVAITRAEEHCYLSFAKSRFRFGKTELSSPSRFLKDIDVRFLSIPQGEHVAQRVDEGASRFRQQMASSFVPKAAYPSRSMNEEHTRPSAQSQVSRFAGSRSAMQTPPPSQGARVLKKVSSISPSRPALSPEASSSLQVGAVIEHERFGIGDVVDVVGSGDNCKATVKFRNAGEKQLLLKFARFKVIG
jgi:DNA helicase-2/ATP-dependent DNA helicase PcrA